VTARNGGQPTATTGMRLPLDLHDRLVQAAQARGVSMNHLMVEAVREFLDRLKPVSETRYTR
jgi:predicted HicB family RNase H-like nuclease